MACWLDIKACKGDAGFRKDIGRRNKGEKRKKKKGRKREKREENKRERVKTLL